MTRVNFCDVILFPKTEDYKLWAFSEKMLDMGQKTYQFCAIKDKSILLTEISPKKKNLFNLILKIIACATIALPLTIAALIIKAVYRNKYHSLLKIVSPEERKAFKEQKEPHVINQQIEKKQMNQPKELGVKRVDLPKKEAKRIKPDILTTWHPQGFSTDLAWEKMIKNSEKALEEHRKIDPSAFASSQEVFSWIENDPLVTPLHFEHEAAEAQGIRNSMEDAHFLKEMEQGVLMGVLDGHGGDKVAHFAAEKFQQIFSDRLVTCNGNVHHAFEMCIEEIQNEISKREEWDQIGSTAVLSFIDKNSHKIYTATLGDSEACIYRKNGEGVYQAIPLSCLRNWASKKDAKRAAQALADPGIETDWPNDDKPKKLRFPFQGIGINVSRAFGDLWTQKLQANKEVNGITHKPKITVNKLKPGDVIVQACDGLRDFVTEKEILEQVTLDRPSDKNLAQNLVNYALNQKNSMDNVTVLVVRIQDKNKLKEPIKPLALEKTGGFANNGQMCFLNTALQCLKNSSTIRACLDQNQEHMERYPDETDVKYLLRQDVCHKIRTLFNHSDQGKTSTVDEMEELRKNLNAMYPAIGQNGYSDVQDCVRLILKCIQPPFFNVIDEPDDPLENSFKQDMFVFCPNNSDVQTLVNQMQSNIISTGPLLSICINHEGDNFIPGKLPINAEIQLKGRDGLPNTYKLIGCAMRPSKNHIVAMIPSEKGDPESWVQFNDANVKQLEHVNLNELNIRMLFYEKK